MQRLALDGNDPDAFDVAAMALRLDFRDYQSEVPLHAHRKGQLVLALRGAVTCRANDMLWIVPPNCGIWIPGGIPHSNLATPNAQLSYLFLRQEAFAQQTEACILSISPLLRELIHRLATFDVPYPPNGPESRLVAVLIEELAGSQRQSFGLSLTPHPKLAVVSRHLLADLSDRRTLGEWANALAMSEKSLSRLFLTETGLTFGRWRQQLHLLHALRELAGGASVQHVSLDLGYSSVTAFITMFKKALGSSPGRYFDKAP